MCAETAKLRTILRKFKLFVYKKINLIQAFLLSEGTFQCSTWPCLSAAFYRRFHGCVMGMYRDALGAYYVPKSINDMFSDDDVIYNNSLIYPNTMIRLSRILLFICVVRKNPPFVVFLLLRATFCKGSRAESLLQDLAWLSVGDKFSACAHFSLSQCFIYFVSREPLLRQRC